MIQECVADGWDWGLWIAFFCLIGYFHWKGLI